MKKILLLPFVLFTVVSNAVNITIIESESFNPGHVMDQKWLTLAQGLGYTAAIYPQTTLDSTNFFSTTDILIVSSGVITLPANRIATILQYMQARWQGVSAKRIPHELTLPISFLCLSGKYIIRRSFTWLADIIRQS